MARRRSFLPPPRTSIGKPHVDAAVATLTRLAKKTTAVTTSYSASTDATIRMLFPSDVVQRAEIARGVVTPNMFQGNYKVDGAILHIDFTNQKPLTIHSDRIELQPSAGVLRDFIAQVRDIHLRFEEVKAVLRYFDSKATPGATRFYWPAAMKLCPDASIWKDLQEVPTRYHEPENIGDWLQSIKDSTTTVAGSALLPADAIENKVGTMRLTFTSDTIALSSRTSYDTDSVTYNI